MRKHKKWTGMIGYFKKIPIPKNQSDNIKKLLNTHDHVLILIKKENHELNPKFTPEEKFKAICDLFPNETKTGKMIISKVPDITEVIESEF